jgi:hypothetical protein
MKTRYRAENARGAHLDGHDDNEWGITGSDITLLLTMTRVGHRC